MIAGILLIFIIISFGFHLYFLARFIMKRDKPSITWFLNTSLTNIALACGLIIVILKNPDAVRNLDFRLYSWIFTGLILILVVFVKVRILRTIYRRAQMPEHFHYNFFGKKVLHPSVIKKYEFITFLVTIPFFLIAGAYFVARLINILLYGHL